MKILKEQVIKYNILLSEVEAKTLKTMMQNPVCSVRPLEKMHEHSPCGKCEYCKLSKKIFEEIEW